MARALSLPKTTVAALGLLLSVSVPAGAQGLYLLPGIREEPVDTLPDVAIATVDSPEPVIYYNPRLMQRYGPALAQFFLAHEYGHLYHHHTRVGLGDLPDSVRDSVLQVQELEADCYASTQLGRSHRESIDAAVRFFTRLGPFRFDSFHPTGAQRAQRIIECLPPDANTGSVDRVGDTGIETGPIGGGVERVRFRVAPARLEEQARDREIRLWIDGRSVGRLRAARPPTSLEVTGFAAGLHSYRVTVEAAEGDGLQHSKPGRQATGTGYLSIKDGDAFTVEWQAGRTPELVRLPD